MKYACVALAASIAAAGLGVIAGLSPARQHPARVAGGLRQTARSERILSALRTSRVSVVATVVGVTSVPATPHPMATR